MIYFNLFLQTLLLVFFSMTLSQSYAYNHGVCEFIQFNKPFFIYMFLSFNIWLFDNLNEFRSNSFYFFFNLFIVVIFFLFMLFKLVIESITRVLNFFIHHYVLCWKNLSSTQQCMSTKSNIKTKIIEQNKNYIHDI